MAKDKNEKTEEKEDLDVRTDDTPQEETTQTDTDEAQSEEPAAEPTIEEQLAMANDEIVRLKDQLLRQIAEFDNYRKRTLKEKTELILNGGEKVISALLPVLDDFERAQQNLSKSADYDTLKEGVDLIQKKFTDILEKQGLKAIDTTDKDFDTDFHEAIAMVPVTDDKQKGKVIDCVATGYTLNEKVIRHAKVAVGQ